LSVRLCMRPCSAGGILWPACRPLLVDFIWCASLDGMSHGKTYGAPHPQTVSSLYPVVLLFRVVAHLDQMFIGAIYLPEHFVSYIYMWTYGPVIVKIAPQLTPSGLLFCCLHCSCLTAMSCSVVLLLKYCVYLFWPAYILSLYFSSVCVLSTVLWFLCVSFWSLTIG